MFSPFVLSVDGILEKEAPLVLANLSQLMAEKMEEPISHVQGRGNGCIAIAVAISYSHIIHGACIPSPFMDRERVWESVLGLRLAQ